MHTLRLGALVVGQSPRPDIVSEITTAVGNQVSVDLRGALDGLSRSEIDALPPLSGKDTLFTRLPDGDGVRISKKAVIERGAEKLEALQATGANAVIVLCTGDFPAWRERYRVIYPSLVLRNTVTALQQGGLALSPNADAAETEQAARCMLDHDPELLVFDCISYTSAMKHIGCCVTGRPAVLAITAAARMAMEALDCGTTPV
jgi:protein AroM